jgi:hypothetical protein
MDIHKSIHCLKKIAELYRGRWTIETAFQHLADYFNSEINALGYPRGPKKTNQNERVVKILRMFLLPEFSLKEKSRSITLKMVVKAPVRLEKITFPDKVPPYLRPEKYISL